MDLSSTFSISRAANIARASVVHLERDIAEEKSSKVSLDELNDSSLHLPSLNATPNTPNDFSSPPNLTSTRHRNLQHFDGIDEPESPQIVSTGSTPQSMRRKEILYLIAVGFPIFLAGWNESVCFINNPTDKRDLS